MTTNEFTLRVSFPDRVDATQVADILVAAGRAMDREGADFGLCPDGIVFDGGRVAGIWTFR